MEDKAILELVNAFDKSSLSELHIEKDNSKIALKKGFSKNDDTRESVCGNNDEIIPKSESKTKQDSALAKALVDTELITSPIVGTYYSKPAPDAPSFVKVGSRVKTGDSLCIIEAMKIMNELQAEFDAEIVEIFPNNGDMLEFGSPLFTVKKL